MLSGDYVTCRLAGPFLRGGLFPISVGIGSRAVLIPGSFSPVTREWTLGALLDPCLVRKGFRSARRSSNTSEPLHEFWKLLSSLRTDGFLCLDHSWSFTPGVHNGITCRDLRRAHGDFWGPFSVGRQTMIPAALVSPDPASCSMRLEVSLVYLLCSAASGPVLPLPTVGSGMPSCV